MELEGKIIESLTMIANAKPWPDGPRVFDWDKAAQIIRDKNIVSAEAGLKEDWEHTAVQILQQSIPTSRKGTGDGYLRSSWATPILKVKGVEVECWTLAEDKQQFNGKTHWPVSAKKILKGETI